MGLFSSVLGSGAGKVLGSLGAAGLDVASASALAKQQQSASRRNYQNRYQWTTTDMRAAGINPILAATMGLGGGASAGASMGTAQAGQTAIKGRLASENLKLLEAQTAKTISEKDAIDQNIVIKSILEFVRELMGKGIDLGSDAITGIADKARTFPIPEVNSGKALETLKQLLPDRPEPAPFSIFTRKPGVRPRGKNSRVGYFKQYRNDGTYYWKKME